MTKIVVRLPEPKKEYTEDNQRQINRAISTVVEQLKVCHEEELSVMNSMLNKESNPTNTWASLAAKTSPGENIPKQLKAEPATYTKIKFTEALYLHAIKVPTFDYVKQNGELYYIEHANHFAIIIAGVLFHGNIGVIFTDEKTPDKIKDCRYENGCNKKNNCCYYHDPLLFANSKDHRNFIANSWVYSSPGNMYKNRDKSRRFGSRNNLDMDIIGLQREEISRFSDQTMHDILCSLLLSRAYNK